VTTPAFYRRWVLANGWSELLGLGTTALLGWLATRFLTESPAPGLVLLGAAVMVAKGTLIEGVVVGVAQGRELRRVLPGFSVRAWVFATALGAGVAWTLGMIPSTLMAFTQPAATDTPPPEEPPFGIILLLAAGMGLVLGPILGLPQWRVLRRFVPRAGWWVPANAAAWAVGMAVIFAGIQLIPDAAPWPVAAAAVGVACLLAGLSVGAIHGLVLVRLLRGVATNGGGRTVSV
jgi:hypothetical protein